MYIIHKLINFMITSFTNAFCFIYMLKAIFTKFFGIFLLLTDLLFGLSDALQLHNPGENGAVAVYSRVDCHRIHSHTWHGESSTGLYD